MRKLHNPGDKPWLKKRCSFSVWNPNKHFPREPHEANRNSMNPALYKAVESHILHQVYRKPGEAVSERKLADQFKISRSPIREALKSLEQEGFIKVVPHRGAFVVSLTLEDIREIFELREALDAFAVPRAALDMDAKRVEKLRAKFAQLVKKNPGISFEDVRGAWSELFDAVFETLSNGRFKKIYSDLFHQVEVVRRFSTSSSERVTETARLGEKLVQALAGRDRDRAEELLKLHRKKSKEAIFQALKGTLAV